jgi:hypothetical protein
MIEHPTLILWENKLKSILDDLDEVLEDQYGHRYRLHPARPGRGKTSSKSHDGLFDISANFTLGIGSGHGKGYVIDIRMVTLEKVPDEIEDQIEDLAIRHIQKKLKSVYPDRTLTVSRDGHIIKLHGDLSLGEV